MIKYTLLLCTAFFVMLNAEVKKAMITGISGQDGAYLAQFLLEKGYEVHGLKRRTSIINTSRVDHLYNDPRYKNRFFLHYVDLTDGASITSLINKIKPDEIYNLAAQSHVRVSFDMPVYTADVDALGPLYILEAIRLLDHEKKIKFYQASTSEMFGLVQETPQKETTPFYPRSPYGVAKVYGHWITKNYREAYGMFACSGILFNHESPMRGETFVTKKIARAAAGIKAGTTDKLVLGNLNAQRDWGHARDYVEAMWLMLQQEVADDFVIATGQTHSVREYVEKTFKAIDIEIMWKGEGVDEIGYDKATGRELIFIDPIYFRPSEVDFLIGDSTKARTILGWVPKVEFDDLVKELVEYEMALLINS